MFTISREGVQDADRDGLLGANRSNSLAIARICNNADRPIPRLHTRVEIVNTLLEPPSASATPQVPSLPGTGLPCVPIWHSGGAVAVTWAGTAVPTHGLERRQASCAFSSIQ